MNGLAFWMSPPVASIDPNMVEEDGLVPALERSVRGFRLGAFEVGQQIRAEDEDGQIFTAEIARIEHGILFLSLVAPATWTVEPSAYSQSVRQADYELCDSGDQTSLPSQIDQNHWSRWLAPSRV